MKKNNYCTYEQAKDAIEQLKCNDDITFKNSTDWINNPLRKELLPQIPTRPDQYYKKTGEWKSWTEFLVKSKHPTLDWVDLNDNTMLVGGKSLKYQSTHTILLSGKQKKDPSKLKKLLSYLNPFK